MRKANFRPGYVRARIMAWGWRFSPPLALLSPGSASFSDFMRWQANECHRLHQHSTPQGKEGASLSTVPVKSHLLCVGHGHLWTHCYDQGKAMSPSGRNELQAPLPQRSGVEVNSTGNSIDWDKKGGGLLSRKTLKYYYQKKLEWLQHSQNNRYSSGVGDEDETVANIVQKSVQTLSLSLSLFF